MHKLSAPSFLFKMDQCVLMNASQSLPREWKRKRRRVSKLSTCGWDDRETFIAKIVFPDHSTLYLEVVIQQFTVKTGKTPQNQNPSKKKSNNMPALIFANDSAIASTGQTRNCRWVPVRWCWAVQPELYRTRAAQLGASGPLVLAQVWRGKIC